MPIEIYTGLPGNGKTAFMVKRIMDEARKAERPLFAAGINGLQPGLATELADPRKWNEVKDGEPGDCNCTAGEPGHAHVVPDGSLIFVDEAWKWFGHLHDASRQANPPHVLQLAEHRHRGIDFVWTTQGPAQLYPFARTLIAGHYHHVRRFGTKFVDVYQWQELNDDVKSQAKRDNAQKVTKALPTDAFGQYKSAEVHTIKARLPLKVWALPLVIPVAGALLWYAWTTLSPDARADDASQKGTESAQADPARSRAGLGPDKGGPKWSDTAEYAQAHMARIPTLPWSAPVFDGREVAAEPEVYCASSGAGLDANGEHQPASCSCLTEQGTPYALPEAECKMLAKQGMPYNPYKAPQAVGAAPVAQGGGTAPTGNASPGATISADQISGYGGIGVGQASSAP